MSVHGTEKPCGWFARRWHRRLRNLDDRLLIKALIAKDPMRAAAAFSLHCKMPAGKHWNCQCGRNAQLFALCALTEISLRSFSR